MGILNQVTKVNRENRTACLEQMHSCITKPLEMDLGDGYVVKWKSLALVANIITLLFVSVAFVVSMAGLFIEIVMKALTSLAVFVLMLMQVVFVSPVLLILFPFTNNKGITKLGMKIGVKK
ncbi:hypothetical protein PHYNN_66 [Pantoea phage Phynn]|nr:hypothetical protein PHYNN_66 [Pantoea phage Phynn]